MGHGDAVEEEERAGLGGDADRAVRNERVLEERLVFGAPLRALRIEGNGDARVARRVRIEDELAAVVAVPRRRGRRGGNASRRP